MGTAREPDLYACAVGYIGVYDLPMLYSRDDTNDSESDLTYLREWVGEPETLTEISPTRLAGRIKVPMFLAAGGEDKRASIAHAKTMERALGAVGVPVQTLYVSTEGHGFYTPEHQREYYTRLLDFLATHLGGEKAAAAGGPASVAK